MAIDRKTLATFTATLLSGAALLATACSDDGAAPSDPQGGGGGGGSGNLPLEQIFAAELDIADDLRGVSIADSDVIYVCGNSDQDGDPVIVVARLSSDGNLDQSFGEGGKVTINTIAAAEDHEDAGAPGDEQTDAVASLSDGGAALVVTRNDGELGDEVVVVRLSEEGELVENFGDAGIARVPLTDWEPGAEWESAGGSAEPNSVAYDLALDTSSGEDRLVVFGKAPARKKSGRVDEDRYIVRILADSGELDETFADDGVFSIDFGEKAGPDEARRGLVREDGSIVSSGYTFYDTVRHHIFLLGLDPDGKPIDEMGFVDPESDCGQTQAGVICMNPFIGSGYAEAYAVAVQDDGSFVTTGYGEPSSGSSTEQDLVSFRFGESAFDSGYGISGGAIFDSGAEDRGRDLVSLPDGRLAHVGMYQGKAAIYLTTPDGTLSESFGQSGVADFPTIDGTFWSVAAGEEQMVAVGDDALVAIYRFRD